MNCAKNVISMKKCKLGCIVRGSEFHRNFKNGTLRTMDTHRTGPWFGTFPSSSVGVLCFGDCPFVLNLTYLETPKPQKNSGGLPPPGPPALKGRLLRGCRKLREIAIFTNFKKKKWSWGLRTYLTRRSSTRSVEKNWSPQRTMQGAKVAAILG